MPFKTMIEVEPPSPLRYIIGAAIMMIGVVLPVGYMMFRNKRVPSTSSYSKQTFTGLNNGMTSSSIEIRIALPTVSICELSPWFLDDNHRAQPLTDKQSTSNVTQCCTTL
ncbi:hypothetical protein PTKIN_Ptkin05aG0031200 [Pterospermum kingtungense]